MEGGCEGGREGAREGARERGRERGRIRVRAGACLRARKEDKRTCLSGGCARAGVVLCI